jgi:hypothetical protein
MPLPQHDPLAHKHFFHSLVFRCVGKHFRAICTLAPFSLTPTSFDTTSILTMLHPDSYGYFFLKDYEPE